MDTIEAAVRTIEATRDDCGPGAPEARAAALAVLAADLGRPPRPVMTSELDEVRSFRTRLDEALADVGGVLGALKFHGLCIVDAGALEALVARAEPRWPEIVQALTAPERSGLKRPAYYTGAEENGP